MVFTIKKPMKKGVADFMDLLPIKLIKSNQLRIARNMKVKHVHYFSIYLMTVICSYYISTILFDT